MNGAGAAIELTVQCAWCGRVMKHGRPWPPLSTRSAAVSHGLCENCYVAELNAIRRGAATPRKPTG